MTILTQSKKIQAVIGHRKAGFLSHPAVQPLVRRLGYIKNAVALLASEVIVVLADAVKPALTTGKPQF